MTTPKTRILGSTLALAVLVGCGSNLAPQELRDARDAYKKAEASPAKQLTPAALDDARQALDRAEQAFQGSEDDGKISNLSYLATRRADIAASIGRTQAAMQARAQAEKDRLSLQEALQKSTTAKLTATERKLEKERLARERAAEDAARREKNLKMTAAQREKALKEKEAKTKAELAKERAARKKLEGKYAAALASLAEVAKIKEEKRGVVITLSGAVLFATGKHTLLALAKNKLDDVAKAVKDQGFKSITVEGHTDSRGSSNKNRELSVRRAESVRTYLVSRGIKSSKIKAVGIGEDRPIASNKTAEGRANNRRVELIVVPEN